MLLSMAILLPRLCPTQATPALSTLPVSPSLQSLLSWSSVAPGHQRKSIVSLSSHVFFLSLPVEDIGFVTIDLGQAAVLDGVRVILDQGSGGSSEFCNVFVNVWDTEPEPPTPVDERYFMEEKPDEKIFEANSIDVFFDPTAAPTTPPTAPSTPNPTAAPTPAPTHPPTAPLTAAPTAGPTGPRKCNVCGLEALDIPCSRQEIARDMTQTCEKGKDYCMTDILQDAQGGLEVYKRCVDRPTIMKEWVGESADEDYCTQYGVVTNPEAYSCHLGCVGDNCNSGMVPDKTKWFNHEDRKLGEVSWKGKKIDSRLW